MSATKTATKATTKKKADVDLIEATVHEVENLTAATALPEADRLLNDAEFNYFKLGGVLVVIQENSWWESEGFENFKEFIEQRIDMPYRKAMYLINIYQCLVDAGIKWDSVKNIGWTKLKDIAPLLTEDNVDEWVQRAETMTTLELQEYIKAHKAGGGSAEEGDEEETKATKVSTMTFKLHEDQRETIRTALDKAQGDNNTEYDAVALEYICMQYLEGGLGKSKKSEPQKSLKDLMAEADVEGTLAIFEELWPDVELSVEMPE